MYDLILDAQGLQLSYSHNFYLSSLMAYGLFPLPETDSDSDSCTVQDFPTGSDSDSDPLIQMYGIGTEICPWD